MTSLASSPAVHEGVTCSNCQKTPIVGIRWKCSLCTEVNLCEDCERQAPHFFDHPMLKMRVPQQKSCLTMTDSCPRVSVQAQRPALAESHVPDQELLKKMLRRETELRLSPEIQALYAQAERSGTEDWMDVTNRMQRQLVRDFGFGAVEDAVVDMLRRASVLYPHDSDFRTIPLYVRHNRARQGDLVRGSPVPDVPLAHEDGSLTSLHKLQLPGRPLVVLAGSIT
eukprot:TRINITY_DN6058_c0_g1_i1.p1 TRINITY_DN6058_c0_g1~~TRINITY_DN6058_c0_g1_i1.p1  ORF type:complete len:225 (-),score=40.22 TRINITY_DN6058_c0_g1_i1:541-1215(-)